MQNSFINIVFKFISKTSTLLIFSKNQKELEGAIPFISLIFNISNDKKRKKI